MVVTSEERKRLFINMAFLFSLRGFDVLIPLIVAPYLVRTVGLNNFGLIAFSLSFSAYFAALINYGFNITTARDIARVRENKQKVELLYTKTVMATGLIIIFALVLAVLLIITVPVMRSEKWLFLSGFFLVAFQSALPTWFFAGYERMGLIAILGVATKAGYILSLLMLINVESDYIYVNALYAVSALVSLLLSFIIIRSAFKVRFVKMPWKSVVCVYRDGFSVFMTQMAPVLYNNSSVFILGFWASPSIVGIYSASMRVIEVFTTGGRIVANVFLPYLAVDIHRHAYFSKFMLTLGAGATVFIFAFSSQISNLLYSESGKEISLPLSWLSIGIFFGFSYLTYGVNYLALVSKERVAAKISLFVSVLGFVLLFITVPIYGLSAAVFVFLLSRLLLSGLSFSAYLKSK